MNIVIKNVTGEPVNDGLILELSKAGYPAGTKVYDVVKYQENNASACYWRDRNGDECVAYLGETCEEIKKLPRITEIHVFSLRGGGMAIDCYMNGKKVGPVKLSREDVLMWNDRTNQRMLAIKYLANLV